MRTKLERTETALRRSEAAFFAGSRIGSFYRALACALAATTVSCASVSRSKDCAQRLRQDATDATKIDFTENETLLLCGDDSMEGWREVPISQTERQLRLYLQERGYYEPEFRLERDTLVFRAGTQSTVREIRFPGAPEDFRGDRYWGSHGKPLSRPALDEIEAWSIGRLKSLGYACGALELRGDPPTGVVTAQIRPGPRYSFPNPRLVESHGINPNTLRRYDAFRPGDPFDSRLLSLTSSRLENSALIVSSSFPFHCVSSGELVVEHRILPGEKNLLQIGIGATTEEFPVARLQWKSVRLTPKGSSLAVRLYASPIHQRFDLELEAHAFPNSPRSYIEPGLTFERWNERDLKGYEVRAPVHIGHSWEMLSSQLRLEIGPTLIYRDISEGVRPQTSFDLAYETVIDWVDHLEEIYAQDPREGSRAQLATTFLSDTLGSTTDALRLSLLYSRLWNLADLEPAKWILGMRWGAMTSFTPGGDGSDPQLPSNFSFSIGGDQDLRGFGRRELPGAGRLALTALYWGTEFRFANSLPARFEPYLFFDFGVLGARTLSIDSTLFASPGFGLRWQSPIGTLRGSLARGWLLRSAAPFDESALEHWQFFVSFGKEF